MVGDRTKNQDIGAQFLRWETVPRGWTQRWVYTPLPGGLAVKNTPAMRQACNAGDTGSIPGSGRFREGNGNPLLYWRRKWQPTPVLRPRKSHGWRSLVQATVHGVTKSWTRLSDFTHSLLYSCLGNPMDRGAWQATVHGFAKEWDTT